MVGSSNNLGDALNKDRAALASAVAFIRESAVPRRCDNEAVSCCIRCNSVYLARRVAELLTLSPQQQAANPESATAPEVAAGTHAAGHVERHATGTNASPSDSPARRATERAIDKIYEYNMEQCTGHEECAVPHREFDRIVGELRDSWLRDAEHNETQFRLADELAMANRDLAGALRVVSGLNRELRDLRQTSGDLCATCGWRGVRGDTCAFCRIAILEQDREVLALEVEESCKRIEFLLTQFADFKDLAFDEDGAPWRVKTQAAWQEVERLRAHDGRCCVQNGDVDTTHEFVEGRLKVCHRVCVRHSTPPRPITLEVREMAAIQLLRAARALTPGGAVEAWRDLHQGWRDHWLMEVDRIIEIINWKAGA